MLAQYIIEHLKSLLLSLNSGIRVPSYLIVLIFFAVAGMLISEGLLAFCIYQYFLNYLGFSEAIAALITSGIFLIVSLLLLLYANCIFKRLANANTLLKGYNAFKGVLAAFVRGFQNPSS
jgi:hypothetical protein